MTLRMTLLLLLSIAWIVGCGDSSVTDQTTSSSGGSSFKLDVSGSSGISAKSASGETAEIIIVPSASSTVNVTNTSSSTSQTVTGGCSLILPR